MLRLAIGICLALPLMTACNLWAAEAKTATPAAAARAAEADVAARLAHFHDPTYSGPHPYVTSLAYSPDGRWIVASFFVGAVNEPGTDWQAWVAEWNLETGERVIIPNACGPVAISADSKTVAMN